jgi:hypothetical protein
MARHLLVVVACGAMAFAAANAAAAPGVETAFLGAADPLLVDPLQEELAWDAVATSTDPQIQHVGPVPSSSPDSGTCGPDWAQDTFDRFFTIKPTPSPTVFQVYEQFKNGTFVTEPGVSPGTCDATDGYGPGTLRGGDSGTMHGYILTNVTCDPALLTTCPVPGASCQGPTACQTTNEFISTFFGPAAIRNDQAYYFHYAGYDASNTFLVVNEWKNASCNRGGNHGDIANTSTGTIPPAACVP